MSMKLKIKTFFGPQRQYAVSGASNDPSKFGFKITSWYVRHELPVIPVNPKASEILGQEVISSVTSIIEGLKSHTDIGHHKLSEAKGLSISFLTPPHITTSTLQQIATIDGYKDMIKGLWFQPGSYNGEVLDLAQELGLGDIVIEEDECILVRGEEGLYSANL